MTQITRFLFEGESPTLNTTKELIFVSKVDCGLLQTRGAGVVSLNVEIQL